MFLLFYCVVVNSFRHIVYFIWVWSPFIFAWLAFKHRNYVENKKQNHE